MRAGKYKSYLEKEASEIRKWASDWIKNNPNYIRCQKSKNVIVLFDERLTSCYECQYLKSCKKLATME
jgi:hypothetical protein